MGNPFKRKKFQRAKTRAKKAVRSTAQRAVAVHRVLDPIVTTGLGVVFGAPGAVVGTGLSWIGMRAVAPMAARNQGKTGTDARNYGRKLAARNATYAAIGGSGGALASLALGGGWLGLASGWGASSPTGGMAAAGSPEAAKIAAGQAAKSLVMPSTGGIIPGAMPAAAGSPQAAQIAAAQAAQRRAEGGKSSASAAWSSISRRRPRRVPDVSGSFALNTGAAESPCDGCGERESM